MADPRHKARELVLQALYEADVAGHESPVTLERLIEEEGLAPQPARFARTLLEGVIAHRDEIDATIARTAPLWPAEQLAPVDRNILRIAIREFLVDNLTPVPAAINEAVELAKAFGSESSPKFVNGVLGALSGEGKQARSEQEVD
ncbi:MAG TPA: transcription antitermination factor NusB [Dehalococcoidia bacterium]|nr:transcription antitermination factor NusB [Dehalococcoidia bacterium]